MRNYGLSTTVFGTELETKVVNANNVLSALWNNLDDVEKAITMFVENQRANNNSAEGGFTSEYNGKKHLAIGDSEADATL